MADMTQHNPGKNEPIGTDAALRRDVLISHIVDGEGDGSAWAEFTKLAGADAGAWRELALAQRDHAALVHAVNKEIDVAELAELPAMGASDHRALSFRLSRWGGWAAAAAVAVTWMGTQFAAIQNNRGGPIPSDRSTAGILPVGMSVDSPQEAISAYKQLGQRSGTVLGEVPRVIIESRALDGGRGFEVVYLRQFMERAQVAELYQVTHDDSGQQGMLVPVSQGTVRKTNRID